MYVYHHSLIVPLPSSLSSFQSSQGGDTHEDHYYVPLPVPVLTGAAVLLFLCFCVRYKEVISMVRTIPIWFPPYGC